jgi:hypothetical protein
MFLIMTDDPEADYDRYMRAQDLRLSCRPQCDCCGEHIQDDTALHYVTRKLDIWICLECIDDNTEYIEVEE